MGQKFSDRQAKAELSTEPYTDSVSHKFNTMIRRIVSVMNIISSLFAIIWYVGWCDCLPLVPLKPIVANLCKLILDIV